MRLLALLPCLALAACVSMASIAPVGTDLEVSHVQRGIMQADESGELHVTETGGELRFAANPKCPASRLQGACMWYGFEFDYDTIRAPLSLDCHSKVSFVSPAGKVREIDHPFNLDLAEAHGHASHELIIPQGPDLQMVRVSSLCTWRGLERLRFETKISIGG